MYDRAMINKYKAYLPYIAWLTSIVATIGSLYLSEVEKLPPCILCWWQRIFMYPLIILLGIGLAKRDKNLPDYILPLSIIGLGIAIYHYLLQIGVLPESTAPCQSGISCTTKQIEWFGFVTIPFLSAVAFAIITTVMFILRKDYYRE
jgi:disulfide bond formation protein DsbB